MVYEEDGLCKNKKIWACEDDMTDPNCLSCVGIRGVSHCTKCKNEVGNYSKEGMLMNRKVNPPQCMTWVDHCLAEGFTMEDKDCVNYNGC